MKLLLEQARGLFDTSDRRLYFIFCTRVCVLARLARPGWAERTQSREGCHQASPRRLPRASVTPGPTGTDVRDTSIGNRPTRARWLAGSPSVAGTERPQGDGAGARASLRSGDGVGVTRTRNEMVAGSLWIPVRKDMQERDQFAAWWYRKARE